VARPDLQQSVNRGYTKLGVIFIRDKFIILLCLMITLLGSIGASSASSATNVHITPTEVTATGFNSASGGYYWCTGTFLNYNPVTKRWGELEWNPKGTAEGEWTMRDDDMDFSINGRCKGLGWQHQVFLVKTSWT
jgi:N-acetylmuramoyl-L-alanine amidase